ncbi:alpha/beta-hydrolase [Xylona heveae TC161]|uniref:Alpha/beta-hydrolase n=1 Tax=Xylona heveae (strain CBS 132557 / TC161) TaxID=1328760 RepID=A0A165FQ78_XYLHT|nr:alpha/beta-hydrolase [Xylona heveae TC161]KZF21248.1 alpha/beta-hydrolase [Xylona heveae TC161]
MITLSSDESFHFELLRFLALARYSGSDVAEVLRLADRIIPGDFESWYTEFNNLAERIESQANKIDLSKHPVSARDFYMRASSYFRGADFYLHGNPKDPRIRGLWQKQARCFDKALSLLPIPGKRITLKAHGFEVPTIFYESWITPAGLDPKAPRPAIVIGNGFDGAQEESMHFNGFAALERGFHVITYEGPGQCTVRREQGLGFIPEWEKVVSPVLDYYLSYSSATDPKHPASLIDHKKVGLIGLSMGGYLAARAAVFESHRLAAVALNDGVYSIGMAFDTMTPQKIKDQIAEFVAKSEGTAESATKDPSDAQIGAAVEALLKQVSQASGTAQLPTKLRWGITHGMWSFNVSSPAEYLERSQLMSLEGGLARKISCPVWVGEAADDLFFEGQPGMLTDAINEGKAKQNATRVILTEEDAAGAHCHVGAACLVNKLIFDWFEDIINASG